MVKYRTILGEVLGKLVKRSTETPIPNYLGCMDPDTCTLSVVTDTLKSKDCKYMLVEITMKVDTSTDTDYKTFHYVGFSKRNPKDKPNEELGYRLALYRALTNPYRRS